MKRQAQGFTLLETIVSLVLMALVASVVFTAIHAASLAESRSRVAADQRGYDALVRQWWKDSTGGLRADRDYPVVVEPFEIRGWSTQPLSTGGNGEARIRWRLGRDEGEPWRLEYLEDDRLTWSFELVGVESARFVAPAPGGAGRGERSKLEQPLQLPGWVAMELNGRDGADWVLVAARGLEAPVVDWSENRDE